MAKNTERFTEAQREAQVAILKSLKTEIGAMDFEKISDDGHTMLISKVDVIDWIDDFMKGALNPKMFERAG